MADLKLELNMEYAEMMGVTMRGKLDQFIADRAGLEQQWLKNLRQYRGLYDPEYLKLLANDKSRRYPRDTRTKVKAFVAKMMEMMFPASEDNWDLTISPIPSIQKKDLEAVIAALTAQEMLAAQQEQRPPQPISSDIIEKGVREFATIRMENMQTKIRDQFADKEMDYPNLCKRVLRSGAIYGAGVAMSPLVKTKTERIWEQQKNGSWDAKKVQQKRPYSEFVKIWDIYPDLSAWTWEEQEGLFHRMVFTRHDFRMLSKRPGFIKDNIKQYLIDNQTGNYIKRSFEAGLDQMNYARETSTAIDGDKRKYEVFRWFGYRSAHDMEQLGYEIPEEDMDKDLLVDIWMIDNTLIKADLAPFGEKPSDVYHAFIYSEDEDAGLTGIGMPEELRDSQMALCSSTRALDDNMAATAGPMLEVAVDLMKRNTDYNSIHSFKVFEREGDGPELQYPAVRAINTPSHIGDISKIIAETRQQFDAESNMPSWMTGNPEQLGEAFRTSRNMSVLSGGANLLPKDNVRSFDRFTASVVNSYLMWNQEFDPDEETMGDFEVRPKGNISLMAKEVRGAALSQEMATMTEDERAIVKVREALIERWKARDLDLTLIMEPDEAEQALGELRQARAMAQQIMNQKEQVTAEKTQAETGKLTAETEQVQVETQEKMAMIEPKVIEIMAKVDELQKKATATEDQAQLASLREMVELLIAEEEATGGIDVAQRGEGAAG